jgi:CheY-like chemotaxis protein
MASAMDQNLVDLLLYDYDLPGEDFVEVMQRIRGKAHGRNPFVVVIATVKDSDMETVRRLISAGVDDLIRKPLSIGRLVDGIDKFTVGRKPFAASREYIGPTRRPISRDRQDPAGLFQVPNTLRSKAVHNVSDAELQRMVDVARIELEDKRLESCGAEITFLAQRVTADYGVAAKRLEVEAAFRRLLVVADDLYQRRDGTSSQQVANLAKMLLAVVMRAAQQAPGQATTEVQLLSKLAQAIRRALTVERNSVSLMQEIVEAVSGFADRH